MMRQRRNAPTRSATDVGPGDYIKVAGGWLRVLENNAWGADSTPRRWYVRAEDGHVYDMWAIYRYAKDGDMELVQ